MPGPAFFSCLDSLMTSQTEKYSKQNINIKKGIKVLSKPTYSIEIEQDSKGYIYLKSRDILCSLSLKINHRMF